jgi:DNA-binding transcriptional LysR family regulator
LSHHPRIKIHAREIAIGAQQFEVPIYRELRERSVDLVFGPIVQREADDDLQIETLFGDPLVVATGNQNTSLPRRTPRLADLIDRQWCLPPPDSIAGARCVAAFRASGLNVPSHTAATISVHLQIGLLASQRFFTMFPGSLMRFGASRLSIKSLPIKLEVQALSIGFATLKGRTISPAARLFIQTAKEIARTFATDK